MALLSQATVIAEAKDRSGSLYQGWEALRLGRQVLILESLAQDKTFNWPKEFLKHGAVVLRRDDIDGFLETLPLNRPLSAAQADI